MLLGWGSSSTFQSYKGKETNKFLNQVISAMKIYNKMKDEYTQTMEKFVANDKSKHKNLPCRILSSLCKWKKRKADENMPT